MQSVMLEEDAPLVWHTGAGGLRSCHICIRRSQVASEIDREQHTNHCQSMFLIASRLALTLD